MPKKYLSKIYEYTVVFESAEEGGFVVTVPALPGCVTEGDTFEEANAMAKDAIECYLGSKLKHNESIPEESKKIFIGTVEAYLPNKNAIAQKVHQ